MRATALSLSVLLVAPAASAPVPASANAPAQQASYETVRIPHDLPAYVLPARSPSREVIVYLHGRCGNPLAGIEAFGEAASARATTISVQADIPCRKNPRLHRWGTDLRHIEQRIRAAVETVAQSEGRTLDSSAMTIIGYSEGALRAESLAKRFPDEFPRVVLIASPVRPTPDGFLAEHFVATLVGTLDAQGPMREGTRLLQGAGLRVRFFSLPGARHGQYGPQGNQVLEEVFDWIRGRAGDASAAP
jgi:predicted esterase